LILSSIYSLYCHSDDRKIWVVEHSKEVFVSGWAEISEDLINRTVGQFCKRSTSTIAASGGHVKSPRLRYPSYGDCLEVKREYHQNCSVLDYVTQNVHSQQHTYVSSSYRLTDWVCHIGTLTLCVEAVV